MSDDRERLIRNLFAAYLGNDRQRVADALADDFRFTSPFDDDIDKAAYFERGGFLSAPVFFVFQRREELR